MQLTDSDIMEIVKETIFVCLYCLAIPLGDVKFIDFVALLR